MHFLGLVILTVAKILRMLINLYTFVVAAAVIVSWVKPDPYNPIVRFLYQATHPVFQKVRRFLPSSWLSRGLDLAPLAVFVLLMVLDTLLVGLLFDAAQKLLVR